MGSPEISQIAQSVLVFLACFYSLLIARIAWSIVASLIRFVRRFISRVSKSLRGSKPAVKPKQHAAKTQIKTAPVPQPKPKQESKPGISVKQLIKNEKRLHGKTRYGVVMQPDCTVGVAIADTDDVHVSFACSAASDDHATHHPHHLATPKGGFSSDICSLAFSPDSKVVAVAAEDRGIRVYQLEVSDSRRLHYIRCRCCWHLTSAGQRQARRLALLA